MRSNSHTLLASVRDSVKAWRRRAGWSRETVTACIVEAFETMGGPDLTGIRFDPPTRDEYERTKNNADRLHRWLDDESKDTNLMPPNFLPFIIAALPLDLRIQCVAEFLLHTGLAVHAVGREEEADIISALQAVARESGEATSAIASLVDGEAPGELEDAERELIESIAAQQAALSLVQHRRAKQVTTKIVAVK